MTVFVLVTASVALLVGLASLVVGDRPRTTGRIGEHESPLRHHPHWED
jgi:hypothetical protein